ncbi:acyltransferase [Siphonobacter sp. SORGH_AS_0500]|uniref:acyltransferase family protein n=1 Tax=Siphonobacter sp. SORGH_AS_0500 TaxID=1864824 RepID=UPI00285F19C7|nr:acyltransferase [Siphonobacter sp. SORGH_AS_0500]MDR6194102.1 peptidoglycan/LPS O-acetylase OafA/YrhL [Siphonobacter sp. SORGH_AS_0500]
MNQTYTFKKTQNNFDFIRFIAAVGVLFSHSYDLQKKDSLEPLRNLTANHLSFSFYGVRIFFIISGFLILKSALNSSSFVNYLTKRALRIFPGLCIALLISVFLFGLSVTRLPILDYLTQPQTYAYLLNLSLYHSQQGLPGVFDTVNNSPIVNGSLWTLVYEFTFYLLLYFALRLKLLRTSFVLLITFCLLIVLDLKLQNTDIINNYYPSLNMSPGPFIEFSIYFMAGMLFQYYQDRFPITKNLGSTAVALFIASNLFLDFPYSRVINYLLLPYVVFYLSFIKGSLNNFGKYGDFSYGIYIYSFPLQQILLQLLPEISVALFAFLSLIVVSPFAYFSWFIVEKPMIRLKSRKTIIYENPISLPV